LFFMLTLLAYMQYAKRKDSAQGRPVAMRDSPRGFYALALFCFALGLMSKPMLVTLPCVLLLLDLWPLQRVSLTSPRPQIANRWPSIRPVLLEKLPFFALAVGSSVVTFLVQQQGGAVDQFMPVSARLSNAVVSYARYLAKTIWPAHLAVPYPHPGHWPGWEVALALGLILALTLAVWVWRSRAFLLVGWLWFLGTLVPVIGLVQVGVQSLADRYTYLPLIGIFVMVVWGAGELFSRWNLPVWARTSVALLLLGALILRTENQLPCWRNSGTLFRHAIELTRNNHVAHGNLGLYLYEHGEAEQAIQQYEAALRIRPNDASNLNRLGSVWASRHDYQQAVKLYQAALRARPDFTDAHNNLGVVLKTMGKTEEARNEYEQALRIEPDNAEAHNNLANLLAGEGTSKEAIKHYRRAISIDPSLLQAWNNLGWTLASEGQFLEAISCYHQALRVKPQESVLHKHLADVLTASGRARAALPEYAEALRLAPNDVEAHVGLARAQAQLGNSEEALTQASEAARLDPANDEAKRLLEQLRQRSGTGAANTNGTHL
jgi:tetratricopeptide (TPR) repeat protein